MSDNIPINWPQHELFPTVIHDISTATAVSAYGRWHRSKLLTSNAPRDPTNHQAWLGAGCVIDMVAQNTHGYPRHGITVAGRGTLQSLFQ
jgi:hypothetical protein